MLPHAGVLATTFTRSWPRGLQLLSPDHAPVKVLLRSLGALARMPSPLEFTCKTTVDTAYVYPKVSQAEGPTHRAVTGTTHMMPSEVRFNPDELNLRSFGDTDAESVTPTSWG
jgi:hypothetical protein